MLVQLYGSTVYGIDAYTVSIEVSLFSGVQHHIVGLPDSSVRESLKRVESALVSNGYTMPRRQLIINLAPADIRKSGAAFDLPIAVGVLGAAGHFEKPESLSRYVIMGELSLDGCIRPIRGALSIALQSRKDGFTKLILPSPNASEAAMIEGLQVYGVDHLHQVIEFLQGKKSVPLKSINVEEVYGKQEENTDLDFADVKGQENIKRALEIAAAGGHNAILIGPPGAGKTMLARRLPGILPPLSLEESLETTRIHSVAGKLPDNYPIVIKRPFRSPHHTISDVALVGGGSIPQPGEISLAHHGVLFLDELPEFKRSVLEVMRQPMEERKVNISRARITVEFPANFMLVASMNPCPCGYYNHPEKECTCKGGVVHHYLQKISGPLMDRIDMHVEVVPVPAQELSMNHQCERSASIRDRVMKARELQRQRYKNEPGYYCNAQANTALLKRFCPLPVAASELLYAAMKKLHLSARAHDRIIRMARTIADLEASVAIQTNHIAEAIHYRSLDRESWGR